MLTNKTLACFRPRNKSLLCVTPGAVLVGQRRWVTFLR
jgi:hypothetical protein